MGSTNQSDERVYLLNAIELCVAIFRGPSREEWTLLTESGLPELMSRPSQQWPDLSDSIRKLHDSLTTGPEFTDTLTDLETEYVRLFIAAAGGVAVPLYESCHLDTAPRTMGESALAMRDRLQAAGLAVSLDSNEPPDHLTIELEYLYHLLSTGWLEDQPKTIEMAENFVTSVMLDWVRRFRDALTGAKPHPAYQAAADTAIGILEAVSHP